MKRNCSKSSASNRTNSTYPFRFHTSFQLHHFIVVSDNSSRPTDSMFLSANGALMNIGAVLWIDSFRASGSAQSTATDLTLLWIILLAIGGIGFILAGLGISGRLSKRKPQASSTRSSQEQSPAPLPAINKYCPQCGTENPIRAGFCTRCGTQLPSQ